MKKDNKDCQKLGMRKTMTKDSDSEITKGAET